MLPNQPWIKILKTANSQEQANKIVQKLQKKGYGDIATIPHQTNSKEFQIGIFDESKIDEVDELDCKTVTTYEKCVSCKKSKVETRFFVCVNCDTWECYTCGFKRLFNEKIPNVHICGKDNFQILANMGPCIKCGEPLGFKSIPPMLKFKIMSKLSIGKVQMMTLGLIGAFSAEKIFLDKEISLTYKATLQLIDIYKNGISNPDEWLKLYKKILSNILRLEWSCDYILQVSDKVLDSAKKNIYKATSIKMQSIHAELEFQKALHGAIVCMFDNDISKSDYDDVLAVFIKAMTTVGDILFSQEAKEAIVKLSNMSDQIKEKTNFNEANNLIGTLFFTKHIKNVMNRIPAHLR